MNFIKVGQKIINLDNVAAVDICADDEVYVKYNSVIPMGEESHLVGDVFQGREGASFRAYLESIAIDVIEIQDEDMRRDDTRSYLRKHRRNTDSDLPI